MGNSAQSVVLAGPSPLLLIGIKQVLEATDRNKVVNQAHASELALPLTRRLCPDYVVLDGTERSHKSSRGGIVDTVHGILAESWGGMHIDMAPMKLLSG